MFNWLIGIWNYIRAFFLVKEEEEKEKIKRRPKIKEDDIINSEFTFKRQILNRLPLYFKYFKRLKKSDRASYDIYKKIGINIIPASVIGTKEEWPDFLSEKFLKNRPAFGGVTYAVMDGVEEEELDKKIWIPKFMYLTKYDKRHLPPGIQRMKGIYEKDVDVYVMHVNWDNTKFIPKKERGTRDTGAVQEYAVAINGNGDVKLLKQKTNITTITKRNGRSFSIPQQRWGYPDAFVHWAEQTHDTPVTEYLETLFRFVANSYDKSYESSTRIEVEKDGIMAVFSIGIKRTPYFFRDREATYNDRGKKKRIFHHVSEHTRRYESGKTITIDAHYRGERNFNWNGYTIRINVPNVNQFDMREFPVGISSMDGRTREAKASIEGEEIGELLEGLLDNDVEGYKEASDKIARRKGYKNDQERLDSYFEKERQL